MKKMLLILLMVIVVAVIIWAVEKNAAGMHHEKTDSIRQEISWQVNRYAYIPLWLGFLYISVMCVAKEETMNSYCILIQVFTLFYAMVILMLGMFCLT